MMSLLYKMKIGVGPMRVPKIVVLLAMAIATGGSSTMIGQSVAKPADAPETAKTFDPHDLSGVWRLPMTPRANLLFRSKTPEPELTPYGKAHLFPGGITHG